ncbi:hypothetical protein [Streptomyces spirodelae]|uniref:Uncharacterized protein n=1 Tax=Streptomyces spirodelae TaxID=2812904 RepID=A0ABS3WP82_9ACTN|nr:hypothetical protein [Streptomyces spirodelae]MBO8184928.1 hypothetical protein [Streptomyces spirodelae]
MSTAEVRFDIGQFICDALAFGAGIPRRPGVTAEEEVRVTVNAHATFAEGSFPTRS